MGLTAFSASEQLGVSVDTIRRWDKKGLIKSIRDNQNYRIFDIEEIRRLHNKLYARSSENNYIC